MNRCSTARAGVAASGLWLLALAAGCGPGLVADPTVVPLASWPAEQAAIICAKIAGCCDGVERMKFFYVNDAQCRAMQADIRSGVNNLIAQGQPVAYNGKAARRCLDEMKATPCVALFNHPEVNVSWPSCDQVAPGTGQLGAPCGGFDMFCESANCVSATSTCGPPRGCSTSCDRGQYCDEDAGRCVPVKTDGTLSPTISSARRRPSAARMSVERRWRMVPLATPTLTAPLAHARGVSAGPSGRTAFRALLTRIAPAAPVSDPIPCRAHAGRRYPTERSA